MLTLFSMFQGNIHRSGLHRNFLAWQYATVDNYEPFAGIYLQQPQS